MAAPRTVVTVPAPTFWTFDVPSTMGWANFAGEPSIGVDRRSDTVLYQAGPATYRLDLSDGTWSDVSAPASQFNVDPILATDPYSGVTLAGGDDGSCSILSETSDDGQSWRPSLPCSFTPDHPTVGIGPAVGSSVQSGRRVVYFCQQYPALDECTTSTDDGTTWIPARPVTDGCIGPSGHVKASADGTAYLPYRACNAKNDPLSAFGADVGGAVSRDNGRSWTSYRIPKANSPFRGFDPSVATTPDNTVYEGWGDIGDYRPVIAWSRDHARTWSRPVDVAKGAGYPIFATAFHAVVAGDNGRVAVAYLGADRPFTAKLTPFDDGWVGAWYLYVSVTYDAARHLDDGTSAGPARATRPDLRLGHEVPDAGVTSDGRVVVGFAEGCQGGCPADPSQVAKSIDAWGAVAEQSGGVSLFGRVGDLS